MFKLVRRIIETVNGDRRLLVIVLLINVAGTLFGLYYYWEQLAMTPWYLWLAVPDCPLYTFFMAIALTLIIVGRPWKTFNTITAVGLSMYGVWTVIVLLWFGEIFFRPENALASWERLISHGAMALESLLLLPYLVQTMPISWAITAVWFGVLDSVDYFYHFLYNDVAMRTHPLAVLEYYNYLYGDGKPFDVALQAKMDSMMYLTYGLSIIFFTLIFILSRIYAKGKLEKCVEEKIKG
ncbi:MAG TPA: DUF1405 domain-containing protein [Methanocella sp.]|nr:DUF1405 domain-containing protein [Methanocella sp.]